MGTIADAGCLAAILGQITVVAELNRSGAVRWRRSGGTAIRPQRSGGILRPHVVVWVEAVRFELADDGVDIAGRAVVPPRDRRLGAVAGRDEAVGFESADHEAEVRHRALFQGWFGGRGHRSLGGCVAVGAAGGDEAVLLEEVDDEGHAGEGSLFREGVEGDGVAL